MSTCHNCNGDGLETAFVGELEGEGEDRPCLACNGTGYTHPAFYSVSVHLIDRCYGGPEEGGWYFTAGEPVSDHIPEGLDAGDMCRLFPGTADGKQAALAWRDALDLKLDAGPNQGRREISSVLSQGRYAAQLQQGFPHHWPRERPHYE